MKNLAIINATALTPYAGLPLAHGPSAIDRTIAFARTLPAAADIVVLGRNSAQSFPSLKTVTRNAWSAKDLFATLLDLRKGFDHLFYFFADAPFLDAALAQRMFDNHVKYFSDYTFADGYPAGLSIEILASAVAEPLVALAKATDPCNRETVFEVLKRDINAFDLETEIAPVDLRQSRVTLFADTKRNFELCGNILAAGGQDAPTIIDVVQKKPELLRTRPAYFPVQIVEGCPQSCAYCPYPVFRGDVIGKKAEMKYEDVERIVRAVKEFSGDATLSFSLWGEPSFHSRIDDLCRLVLGTEGLDLVIETSGLGWDQDRLVALAASLSRPPLWIVSLDSWDEAGYRRLRGDGFTEAVATARRLLSLFPGRVYVQAVRMKDNDIGLETFYREWKKETENLIIQKYDSCAGFLPDRKVSDLSPLKRLPCWHLKRDLHVLCDGSVPLCRADVTLSRPLGNILKEPLADIWERGAAAYREHLAEDYRAPCAACDEYYTFNF
jgi:spiro-SPASM protein